MPGHIAEYEEAKRTESVSSDKVHVHVLSIKVIDMYMHMPYSHC